MWNWQEQEQAREVVQMGNATVFHKYYAAGICFGVYVGSLTKSLHKGEHGVFERGSRVYRQLWADGQGRMCNPTATDHVSADILFDVSLMNNGIAWLPCSAICE